MTSISSTIPALPRILKRASQLFTSRRVSRLARLSFFFAAAPLSISTATAITYPPTSSFLYGNSSVDQVGKTSLVAGSGLPYRYVIPKNYAPNIQYPVIVFLHGQGRKGTNNTRLVIFSWTEGAKFHSPVQRAGSSTNGHTA